MLTRCVHWLRWVPRVGSPLIMKLKESKTNIGENFNGFCNLVFDTMDLSFLFLSPTNNAWQVMGLCFALFGTVW